MHIYYDVYRENKITAVHRSCSSNAPAQVKWHLHNGLSPRRKVSISFCIDFCKGFYPGRRPQSSDFPSPCRHTPCTAFCFPQKY